MLDARIRPWIDPPLDRMGRMLARTGIGADAVTLGGLAIGLGAASCAAGGAFGAALILVLVSRLADGLDGAIARATSKTDFGGYLDIISDFLFYGAIPLAFAIHDPAANALAATFLLCSFYVNGTSFMGFALLAEKHGIETDAQGQKSLYFSNGLLEGTETIVLFVLFCLLPEWFAPLAWIFGTLCFATAILRVAAARQIFAQPRKGPNA
ncbi:CDP-alcohol phosphatidyltransferase family protein [Palleronia sp. LCG004]|uniref:CDP-alcohol phosphatidyltransferase family protein n=1 Tax=Palleronia sp. LCG004 TaxID=3079304 RepID=UPI0029431802|nr:CDP-alcohol phosphatidyltransferase family protein [Palleronia sp. LCG004]WOI56203.1 CDP-alcohol phosphatidyltransferase family protein [Palleronia sp. LCG004]